MSSLSKRESILPPLWVIVFLCLGLAGWLIYALKEIVVLLVVGYCVAYLLDPALRYLERKNVSRPLGVFLLLSAIVLFLGIVALTAAPTIIRESYSLVDNFPEYLEETKSFLRDNVQGLKVLIPASLIKANGATILEDYFPSFDSQAIRGLLTGIVSTLLKGYSLALTLLNLVLLPFIIFYLAVDFPMLHSRALALVPFVHRGRVQMVAREMDQYIAAFVRGQMLVGAILFVLYAIGLGFVGVELWLLLAVIAGFGNMIPYVGTISGIVLASIMALVTFGDFSHLVQVWIVFAVVQFLEGNFITPRVLGDSVGLSPLAIILAIIAGGTLLGLLGVVLAVPIAAALKVLAKYFHRWLILKAV